MIRDAITNLDALRAYIVAAYGGPERVVIKGDSSGADRHDHLRAREGPL